MDVKLAGCVILYNPDKDVIRNIESYIKSLEKLYIIDNQNGEFITNELKNKYDNVEIIKHSENMGIAYSLNEVLSLCQNEYTHLLTMDQDSCFDIGIMDKYKKAIPSFDWEKTLGVGPKILDYSTPPKCSDLSYQETMGVITSGNIISVKNAINIGGFDEKLFIDEVDYDFCYRGILKNYKVYIYNSGIYLKHSLGNMIERFFIYRTLKCMNHNYIRKYYIMRNRFYVYKKYHAINEKFFVKNYLKANARLIFDILFFEEDKFRKLKWALIGAKDFLFGNMGKKNFN